MTRALHRLANPTGLQDDAALRAAVDGKVVLITGASFGLGEATARLLAGAGASVILAARTRERLDALAAEITGAGGRAVAHPLDLCEEASIAELVEWLLAEQPGVDIVVNNAGKSIRRSLHLQYDRYHDFTRAMGVNYLGPVQLLLGLLPGMRERGGGHVINVSTIGARVPPAPRWGAYQASKGAFDTWLRSVTPELEADGVHVSTLYMALLYTRMSAPTPSLHRVPGLHPDEGARIVARAVVDRPRSITPPWLGVTELAGVVARRPFERVLAATSRRGDDTPEARGDAAGEPVRHRRPVGGREVREGFGTARVLARAGVLRPMRPSTVTAMRRAAQFGSSLATVAAVSAARWPDRVALIDDDGPLSYQELDARSAAVAAGLAEAIGPEGGALAVMGRNHRGTVEAVLAAGRLGLDTLLVNTELPASQLGEILGRFPVAAMLHDDEFAAAVDASGFAGPRHVIGATPPAARPAPPPASSRVTRIILLTSGTTGPPRGVAREPSARVMVGAVTTVVDRLGIRSGDAILIAPPLFHGFGVGELGIGLTTGATIVLQRRFDAASVVDAVERHRVRTLAVVPVMLQRLLTVPSLARRTGSLRAVLSGGAPLPPSLAATFMDTVGDVLCNGYGSSEVGLVALAGPSDLRAAPGTVGRAVSGVTLHVLDPSGAPVPPGETGRIFVGGAQVFEGYAGGGGKPVVAGLTDTGDVGHLDASDRLFVDGRSDDMIVSGGENVFPRPVEEALLAHPGVRDAAVVAVDDAEFGRRLRAVVVAEGVTEAELREHLRARLARYELPRDIVHVDELPRNPTGKVARQALLDLA
jgi:acyl-CoA synthetase (AMP-forming)/AMP-acid ligase II/NAD(P)-dependent dehydrogenase (short-subunit alcohol dehydrogenase family)